MIKIVTRSRLEISIRTKEDEYVQRNEKKKTAAVTGKND